MLMRRDGVATCCFVDNQGLGNIIAIGGSNGTGILATAEQAIVVSNEISKDTEIGQIPAP